MIINNLRIDLLDLKIMLPRWNIINKYRNRNRLLILKFRKLMVIIMIMVMITVMITVIIMLLKWNYKNMNEKTMLLFYIILIKACFSINQLF